MRYHAVLRPVFTAIFTLFVIVGCAYVPSVASAQAQPQAPAAAQPKAQAPTPSPTKLQNPLGEGTTIVDVIRRAVTAFLGISGAIALLVFVYGGVVYMTAGGSDRVKEAQDTLKYAFIGLVIITFAYTISNTFLYVVAGSAS
jgi:hypothetical protein